MKKFKNSKNLICPVCGGPLRFSDRTYSCPLRHSFDVSRSGYVNLLTGSSTGHHGDDRLMVNARTAFLEKGYYDPLANAVAEAAARYAPDGAVIVDAGCGEGKYTCDVLNAVEGSGKSAEMIGVDISKEAVNAAARRSPELVLAVASTASIPVRDGAADVVLNIFSPFFPEQFSRILHPGGILIRVVPLERHLWELKELVYDTPYLNDVPSDIIPRFSTVEIKDIRYGITLENGSDIESLFKMTPYYYKTSVEGQARAASARHLKTRLEFRMMIFRKDGG